MKKYIKNRTIVDAMQWDGTPEKATEIITKFNCLVPPGMPALSIVGQYGMEPWDWMVTHKAGQQVHIYVVKAGIFSSKYKPYVEDVAEEPKKKKAKA